jgi:hypothetical protein
MMGSTMTKYNIIRARNLFWGTEDNCEKGRIVCNQAEVRTRRIQTTSEKANMLGATVWLYSWLRLVAMP